MNTGLSERDISTIQQIFNATETITLVHLFGSRAKGTYKTGSDIDLAIMNKGVTNIEIAALITAFEESNLPYFVDLIIYEEITAQKLKEHLDRVGVVFYKK